MDKKEQKNSPEAEDNKSKSDPQENMEGPVSSLMQNIKEAAEEDDEVSKEEADKEKDEKM